MTWNGNGVFDPPGTPEFPAIPDDVIRSAYYNSVIRALCTGFGNTIPRDGQAPITGNINGDGLYTMINLPPALTPGQAVRFQEFQALQNSVNALGIPTEPFVYQNLGII